ncbi:MAG: alpha/beta hydrolase [Niabella sp.]|nr:MAG: alpha/beta hydrolase [Niabella sp.]
MFGKKRKKKTPPAKPQKVYFVPGFGADEKIFYNLRLQNINPVYLNWLDPFPKESYQAYVKRMAEGIKDENPIIVGVSFGGMLALEIARTRAVKQIVLISSIKTSKELPVKWKLAGRLKLNKILPIKHIQRYEYFYTNANKKLGAVTNEEQEFANSYRRTIRSGYLIWALNQILNWQNEDYPANVIHIHGDEDKIFPIKSTNPTHIIKGGTHMSIMNRADEISKILNEVLPKIS